MNYRNHITIEPNKRGAKPCVRGLRITVYEVLEYLANEEKPMLTLEMAIQKIQQFSPEQRNKVIEFIEFLEFQASQTKTIEQKNDDSDREQSFFDLAGIWSGKNITLDDIRKDAWGKENQ